MASAEIALVSGLKVQIGCQDRLCMNSDADETLAASQVFLNHSSPPKCGSTRLKNMEQNSNKH